MALSYLSFVILISFTSHVLGWIPGTSSALSNIDARLRLSRSRTKCELVRRFGGFRLSADCRGDLIAENLCKIPSTNGQEVSIPSGAMDSKMSRRAVSMLPLVLLGSTNACADVQLTYGSGSFSGSSVVNGVLSAYGLPQLPDTKGFTPFLSQYQVKSN
jgi:hypothetical protein